MLLLSALSALLGCSAPSCEQGGVTYASGESWGCSDGCNTCSCDAGSIVST